MPGKLTYENGNEDILTSEEFIAAQSAVIKIRQKRFDEDRRNEAKLKEIETRERLKIEKEEAKADREIQRLAAIEAGRKAKAEGVKAERLEKARERAERDAKKAAALESARMARNKDREFRNACWAAKREDDNDARAMIRVKTDQRLGQGPFANWEPVGMLRMIMVGTIISSDDKVGGLGIRIFASPENVAVAIDHPAIMKKLDCPAGYHLVLRQHPDMVDSSRAVWFGDEIRRCIVFSLPIEGGGNA